MPPDARSRQELIADLKRLSFYWRELSQDRSDAELAQELARLQTDRQAVKGIFNYKIF
jgi:hypothetical protein